MLLSSDRQVVPHEHRPEMELLHADLRRVADSFPELYWQAPPSYLGDRVSRGIWFEGLYFEGRKCSGVLGEMHANRVHPGTLETHCRGSVPDEDAVRDGRGKEEDRSLCAGSRCLPTVGPSTMSCTQSLSVVMSSFPMRAGRTWCCRWLSGVGVSGWDGGPAQLPALTLVHVCLLSGQPDEHRLPGAGIPSTRPHSPGTVTTGRGEQSWPGSQSCPGRTQRSHSQHTHCSPQGSPVVGDRGWWSSFPISLSGSSLVLRPLNRVDEKPWGSLIHSGSCPSVSDLLAFLTF